MLGNMIKLFLFVLFLGIGLLLGGMCLSLGPNTFLMYTNEYFILKIKKSDINSRAVTKAVVKILKKICIRRWDYILSKKNRLENHSTSGDFRCLEVA